MRNGCASRDEEPMILRGRWRSKAIYDSFGTFMVFAINITRRRADAGTPSVGSTRYFTIAALIALARLFSCAPPADFRLRLLPAYILKAEWSPLLPPLILLFVYFRIMTILYVILCLPL